jgi:hypothetical protein
MAQRLAAKWLAVNNDNSHYQTHIKQCCQGPDLGFSAGKGLSECSQEQFVRELKQRAAHG